MINSIKRFLKNEDGAETLEYVVIVAVIIIVGSVAYKTGLKDVVDTAFATMKTAMGTAAS